MLTLVNTTMGGYRTLANILRLKYSKVINVYLSILKVIKNMESYAIHMKELFVQYLCSLFRSQERLSTEMGRVQGGRSMDKVGLKRTVLKSERS